MNTSLRTAEVAQQILITIARQCDNKPVEGFNITLVPQERLLTRFDIQDRAAALIYLRDCGLVRLSRGNFYLTSEGAEVAAQLLQDPLPPELLHQRLCRAV